MLSGVTSSSRSRWPWQQPSTTLAQRSTEPEHCQGGDGVLRDVRGLRCGGWWSAASLVDVRPQERLQQRIVEQIVDPVPLVPLLHAFLPQMLEQLVDFLAPLDFRVAEQVIEVPKIVCPPRAARTVLGVPQTVEQLMEVPTEPGYAFAVVAVQTLGWTEARALFEQLAARPGRDTNTGHRDGG